MKNETKNKEFFKAQLSKTANVTPMILPKEEIAKLSPEARNQYSRHIAEFIAKDHSVLFKKLAE